MGEKARLDTEIFKRGMAESREKAKALIMAGLVYVNGQKELKGGTSIKEDDVIEVRGNNNPFVSRGGLKLQKAAEKFNIDLSGCVCMDIGASTGGFTDCMLSHGAKKVYSIDVGYGQLAWKLRTDDRVVNMERTNFRYVTHEQIPEDIDFASVDVSFISLKKILPVMRDLLSENGQAVCLIKPQFEAGRENIGKGGIVRDKKVHFEVIKRLFSAANALGLSPCAISPSAIEGGDGNREYVALFVKGVSHGEISDKALKDIINSENCEVIAE